LNFTDEKPVPAAINSTFAISNSFFEVFFGLESPSLVATSAQLCFLCFSRIMTLFMLLSTFSTLLLKENYAFFFKILHFIFAIVAITIASIATTIAFAIETGRTSTSTKIAYAMSTTIACTSIIATKTRSSHRILI
jgi:hypothetical protein